mmetsp:Transcript_8752/g.11853  ORF Transcript_8752/g.11853 Transcript_8752/m.11853 type:complete len:567 (+) Transcript_8752:361-2061(+)|eukprot:CAMPEP_0196576018 /NCGR_PEP_ID=MMETSP1081-20130531/5385_1 /TAXON_ID=36882 /ORGANISM="Pyramimonas amylifera, Strain CCMP720" /LENGTH=566 /DNA_ID=CAMNT_0041894505 /DNA_START=358 /DNA_END=2058 /DNA_ORIENTATION=+
MNKREEYFEKLGDFLQTVDGVSSLLDQFVKGVSAERKGDFQTAAQFFLSIGVELFQRGDAVEPNAAERFMRMGVELARKWDHKVPEYLYSVLEGHNFLLGDSNAWLGHALTRRGRLDVAEACFSAAVKAVQHLDVREVGEKLLCAAHIHRMHTRNVSAHKAIIRKWSAMLEERKFTDCEMNLVHSRVQLLTERQALYTVRNKLYKAYTLGKMELLPAAERLENFPLRRRCSISPALVHDNLSKLSIQQGEHQQAEQHIRAALQCRLQKYNMLRVASDPSPSTSSSPPFPAPFSNPSTPSPVPSTSSPLNEVVVPNWDGMPSKVVDHDMDLALNLTRLGEHLIVQKQHARAAWCLRAAARLLLAAHRPAQQGRILHTLGMCLVAAVRHAPLASSSQGLSYTGASTTSPGLSKNTSTSLTPAAIKAIQEEAAAVFSEAVAAKEAAFGEDCGAIVESLGMRAEMLWDLNQATASEEDLQRALKVARSRLGDKDPATKKILQQLVGMKAKKKAMEDALGRLIGARIAEEKAILFACKNSSSDSDLRELETRDGSSAEARGRPASSSGHSH